MELAETVVSEIKIKIKDEEVTMTEQFLCYDAYSIAKNDEMLAGLIEQVKSKFTKVLVDPEITVSIKISW